MATIELFRRQVALRRDRRLGGVYGNQPLPRTGRAPNRHVRFTVVLLRLAAQGW